MPIGKNAIKRVENNGYSNVASSAPDMENSVVAEPVAPAAAEKPEPVAAPATAVAPAKRRGRPSKAIKEAKKEAEAKAVQPAEPVRKPKAPAAGKRGPRGPRKAEAKASVRSAKNGFERVAVGDEMPYWLL